MNETFIGLLGLSSALAAAAKGPGWAFRWLYLPVLVLVPLDLQLSINGLPDLDARRAVIIGLFAGAMLAGRGECLIPRWSRWDLLMLAPVLSFAVSYGLHTDFKGFYHRLTLLVLDWGFPYLLARALLTSPAELRAALLPLGAAATALAVLAVYECKMATRLAMWLWQSAGFDVEIPRFLNEWRWGLLRARASFGHPIALGTFFTTMAPLMIVWRVIDPRRRKWALLAACACAAGCLASLSRGPMLALAATALFSRWLATRSRALAISMCLLVILVAPFLIKAAREEVQYTRGELEERGNTTSGHYRVALLLIYGKEIAEVGPWGDWSLDLDYEQCWSIDNAYLYLFIFGGWFGGGLMCLIVITLLYRGVRGALGVATQARGLYAGIIGSFAGISACMANVWFAPNYAPLFWIVAGLVMNINPGARRPVQIPKRKSLAAPHRGMSLGAPGVQPAR